LVAVPEGVNELLSTVVPEDDSNGIDMSESPHVVRIQLLSDHPAFGSASDADFRPAREGDAGIDLVACETITLAPGQRAAVSAGIRIALPPGVEGQVRPRSGRSLKEGLTVVNAPGTIDPGYRGPVKVLLMNASAAVDAADLEGPEEGLVSRLAEGLAARSICVERGTRVAQLVFNRFERPAIEIVARVDEDTNRGVGGFGSTGVE
jgi:dUTP pyrophosphatase